MKRVISILLVIILFAALSVPAFAASTEATKAADNLYSLGLFKGTGTKADGTPIYDLDKDLARAQAVTMLVRLLGKEQEAEDGTWDIPFTDVENWAKPYVGYAYANGLTSGTSATTFDGGKKVTAAQYLTFILRALDYESGKDFTWSTAWEKTDALLITHGEYSASMKSFNRADAVVVSEEAMYHYKNHGGTLIYSLVQAKAVPEGTPYTCEAEKIDEKTIASLSFKPVAADVHDPSVNGPYRLVDFDEGSKPIDGFDYKNIEYAVKDGYVYLRLTYTSSYQILGYFNCGAWDWDSGVTGRFYKTSVDKDTTTIVVREPLNTFRYAEYYDFSPHVGTNDSGPDLFIHVAELVKDYLK